MTGIGSTTQKPFATTPPLGWGLRFDAWLDRLTDLLMKSLCRASRGYLCPPDMTSVMYPDEPAVVPLVQPGAKEYADAQLPGK